MMNTIEELNLNEMEQVSGGGILQRLKCLVGKHDWDMVEWSGYHDKGTTIYLWHYVCSGCDRHAYERTNNDTGKTEEISEKEFKRCLALP